MLLVLIDDFLTAKHSVVYKCKIARSMEAKLVSEQMKDESRRYKFAIKTEAKWL